ncbi:unnamed protein product [Polarella glacialis]|uniref:F-box domain-containing protein n=1 Tax=Polarella glacialis TaxID=89957 RepID=A0A813D2I5_POLGL|nr:unnamed protein product [Polarella glacialis]
MEDLPDALIIRVLTFTACLGDLVRAAAISRCWRTAALQSHELHGVRESLARSLCAPRAVLRLQLLPPSRSLDWLEFCGRQLRLQTALEGRYMGNVTPENLPRSTSADDFDWDEQHFAMAELHPASLADDCCGTCQLQLFADSSVCEELSGRKEWLVLDRRHPLDSLLWEQVSRRCEEEVAEERWEDGDLHCGVRGAFDFRPAVDPGFLDLSPLVLVLCSPAGVSSSSWTAWCPRLYAPCAWMMPKRESLLERLDHAAEFRHEATVAALTLGRQLERPIRYEVLEALAATAVQPSASQPSEGAPGGRRKGGHRRSVASQKPKKVVEPRDMRSGRNPKGLNLFVPRRKVSDGEALSAPARGGAGKNRPAPSTRLLCDAGAADLPAFLAAHRPSLREAEQLSVVGGQDPATEGPDFDLDGLLDDAARLEMAGVLSQTSVVDLAKKWRCLSGKWLLFVPEWRVDQLFEAAAVRLRDKELSGCSQITVSPPGTYGTDPSPLNASKDSC